MICIWINNTYSTVRRKPSSTQFLFVTDYMCEYLPIFHFFGSIILSLSLIRPGGLPQTIGSWPVVRLLMTTGAAVGPCPPGSPPRTGLTPTLMEKRWHRFPSLPLPMSCTLETGAAGQLENERAAPDLSMANHSMVPATAPSTYAEAPPSSFLKSPADVRGTVGARGRASMSRAPQAMSGAPVGPVAQLVRAVDS